MAGLFAILCVGIGVGTLIISMLLVGSICHFLYVKTKKYDEKQFGDEPRIDCSAEKELSHFLGNRKLCIPDRDRIVLSQNATEMKRVIYDCILRISSKYEYLPVDVYDWEHLSDEPSYVRSFEKRCATREDFDDYFEDKPTDASERTYRKIMGKNLSTISMMLCPAAISLLILFFIMLMVSYRPYNEYCVDNIISIVNNTTLVENRLNDTLFDNYNITYNESECEEKNRSTMYVVACIFIVPHVILLFFAVYVCRKLIHFEYYVRKISTSKNKKEQTRNYSRGYYFPLSNDANEDEESEHYGATHTNDDIPLIPLYVNSHKS